MAFARTLAMLVVACSGALAQSTAQTVIAQTATPTQVDSISMLQADLMNSAGPATILIKPGRYNVSEGMRARVEAPPQRGDVHRGTGGSEQRPPAPSSSPPAALRVGAGGSLPGGVRTDAKIRCAVIAGAGGYNATCQLASTKGGAPRRCQLPAERREPGRYAMGAAGLSYPVCSIDYSRIIRYIRSTSRSDAP